MHKGDQRCGGSPGLKRPGLVLLVLAFLCLPWEPGNAGTPAASRPLQWFLDRALQDAPGPRLADASTRFSYGRYQEEAGRFDRRFLFQGTLSHTRDELLPAAVRAEQGRRRTLELLDSEFSRIADDLEQQLLDGDSPANLDCGDDEIIIDGRDVCQSTDLRLANRILNQLLVALIDAEPDPETEAELVRLRELAQETNRRTTQELIDNFRDIASGARRQREQLGDVPREQRTANLLLDFSLVHSFRSGASLAPQFIYEVSDSTFVGKRRSPARGGQGTTHDWRAAAGVTWTHPLGRGRRESAAAEEDAARLRWQADMATAASQRVNLQRQVARAYWAQLASQLRVDLAARNLRVQTRLSELGVALEQGDQITRSDLLPLRAERLQAEAQHAAARAELRALRQQLALLIGLPVDDLDRLPLAGEEFPQPQSDALCFPALADAVAQATRRRHDREALRLQDAAARRLVDDARDLLRPRVDFSLTLAWSGRQESMNIFEGTRGSLLQEIVGPSLLVVLDGDLSPRNRQADGRMRQRLAIAEQTAIRESEFFRGLRARLVQHEAALGHISMELRARERALSQYRQVVEDTREMYQLGNATVIDTLTTELQRNGAELAWIDVQTRYALLLADLVGELGLASPIAADAMLWKHLPCASTDSGVANTRAGHRPVHRSPGYVDPY